MQESSDPPGDIRIFRPSIIVVLFCLALVLVFGAASCLTAYQLYVAWPLDATNSKEITMLLLATALTALFYVLSSYFLPE
jgi:hypothetical protein